MTQTESPARAIARNVLVVVGVLLTPVHHLPPAEADHLADHRGLPGDRPGGAGQLLPALHEARRGDLPRLPEPARHPDRPRRRPPPADRQPDLGCRHQRPQLRPRRRGLRPQEQDAQRPQQQVRHHPEALGRGEQAAEQGGRRGEGAARHRLRPGQLDLRRRDDPDPEHLHGGLRAAMDRELHPDAETGARRADRANPAEDRERGRQLRRRRAAAGDDRRSLLIPHADDPRGPLRRTACGGDLRLRPDPGGRRDDRRGARRDRHRVRQLPASP